VLALLCCVVGPYELKASVGKFAKQFTGYRQHDAQEVKTNVQNNHLHFGRKLLNEIQ
jgi:hypothetical protein